MGHPVSLETRAKISSSRMGWQVSSATRAKISAAGMGNTHGLGHHCSAETRAKMSTARAGYIASPETREKISVANWKGGRLVSGRKQEAKRRALGWNTLNSWFAESDGHHINKTDVIYIPAAMHDSVRHNIWTGKNMEKINAMACQWCGKMSEGEVLQ